MGCRRETRRGTPPIRPADIDHTVATAADGLDEAMGIASLGGATLDNEENYLIKKLFTALVFGARKSRACVLGRHEARSGPTR
jgi:hypothetical protein